MGTLNEGEQEWDWATAGCTGKAKHEMTRDDPLQSDEHKGLLEAVNAFYEEQTTWPELAELNSAWSTCMADQGHPGFAAQTDAAQSLYDEYAELQESAGAAGEVDEAALDALGKKEVELALADFDCREKIDYQPKHEKITFEKEQQFVDDHKAELDAMKADAEQGR